MDTEKIERQEIKEEKFRGVSVTMEQVSYALGVIGEEKPRLGASLGANGAAWTEIGTDLPSPQSDERGTSLSVDFSLEPQDSKTVRIVLAWYAPEWQGAEKNRYTHMYTIRYGSALDVARRLAEDHA